MKDDYVAVLLEDVNSKFDQIIEVVSPLLEKVNGIDDRLDRIDQRLEVVEGDLRVIKAAVTEQSKELDDHEHRIGQLEARPRRG